MSTVLVIAGGSRAQRRCVTDMIQEIIGRNYCVYGDMETCVGTRQEPKNEYALLTVIDNDDNTPCSARVLEDMLDKDKVIHGKYRQPRRVDDYSNYVILCSTLCNNVFRTSPSCACVTITDSVVLLSAQSTTDFAGTLFTRDMSSFNHTDVPMVAPAPVLTSQQRVVVVSDSVLAWSIDYTDRALDDDCNTIVSKSVVYDDYVSFCSLHGLVAFISVHFWRKLGMLIDFKIVQKRHGRKRERVIVFPHKSQL